MRIPDDETVRPWQYSAGDRATIGKFLQQVRPQWVGRFDTTADLGQFTNEGFSTFHSGQSKEFTRVIVSGAEHGGSHPQRCR